MAQPVHKIRCGNVTATVWENVKDDKTFFSINIERNYKVGDEWKTTPSYGLADLPKVKMVADLSYKWLMVDRKAEGE